MPIGNPVDIGSITGSGSSFVITTTGTAPSGSTIIVVVVYENSGAVSVVDDASNSYESDVEFGVNQSVAFLRASNISQLTSGSSITITKPSNRSSARAIYITGLSSVDPLDASNTAEGSGTGPTVTATTTNASDIVIGAISYSGASTSETDPSGWTQLTDVDNSFANLQWGYRIESSTGTFTYDSTLGGTRNWSDAIVSYKEASEPPVLFSQSIM